MAPSPRPLLSEAFFYLFIVMMTMIRKQVQPSKPARLSRPASSHLHLFSLACLLARSFKSLLAQKSIQITHSIYLYIKQARQNTSSSGIFVHIGREGGPLFARSFIQTLIYLYLFLGRPAGRRITKQKVLFCVISWANKVLIMDWDLHVYTYLFAAFNSVYDSATRSQSHRKEKKIIVRQSKLQV